MNERSSFIAEFRFRRFVVRVFVSFLALLEMFNKLADWSDRVSRFREGVKHDHDAIFKAFAVWVFLFTMLEIAWCKVRYDLAVIRYEKLARVSRGRGPGKARK